MTQARQTSVIDPTLLLPRVDLTEPTWVQYRVILDDFYVAYPRLYCPACHKRVSPEGDTVVHWDYTVDILCPHCEVRSVVEWQKRTENGTVVP